MKSWTRGLISPSDRELVSSIATEGWANLSRLWILRIRKLGFAGVLLIGFSIVWSAAAEAKKDKLPRLAGAELLVGWPPSSLAVTSGAATFEIQSGSENWNLTPSISADGQTIASARAIPSDIPAAGQEIVVGTYSIAGKKWTEYKNLVIVAGSVAISPDGSKLACRCQGSPLHILDLKTGKADVAPKSASGATNLSWSPDGRRIAFELPAERSIDGVPLTELRAVFVMDVESGTLSKIADGILPSWSPTGEWIAFYGYPLDHVHTKQTKNGWYDVGGAEYNVSLIRPDGTDATILGGRDKVGSIHPVWSPDSRTLMINRLRNEEGDMDIFALDIATHKLTKKFKDVQPVYGWAVAP